MKRSSKISLVLLTSMSVVALAGCGEEEPKAVIKNVEPQIFESVAACEAKLDKETCAKADAVAKADHLNNAPRFKTVEECAKEFGKEACVSSQQYATPGAQPAQSSSGATDFFVPMMMGYMMGSAMNSPAPVYYGSERERRNGSSPVYSSGTGYSRSAPIGNATYTPKASGTSTKADMKATTSLSSRGGFGSSFTPTKSFAPTPVAKPSTYSSKGTSSFKSSTSGSSFKSTPSVSARGGFGSGGRGFGSGS